MGASCISNELSAGVVAAVRWRHSLATELIRAGVGVAQVQRHLGHASVVSTMLYTHLHVDDVRQALDDVFDPPDEAS